MMENPKHPESESPERPQFLDYRRPVMRPDRPRMTGGQIAAGFGCWILSLGGAYCFACLAYGLGMKSQSGWGGLIGWLAVLVPCSVYFAGRLRWRGFGPGVLIGAALTCLVPVGIVAAMCWHR
jgi:hypothetical protein